MVLSSFVNCTDPTLVGPCAMVRIGPPPAGIISSGVVPRSSIVKRCAWNRETRYTTLPSGRANRSECSWFRPGDREPPDAIDRFHIRRELACDKQDAFRQANRPDLHPLPDS